jgi:arsenate reductase-like glutaredoxin family protein
METIIIKSKDSRKTKAVLDFLKKNRMKADIYAEPSKEEILNNIEKGAKEVAAFLKGRKKLKNAKDLLREL